MCAAKQCTNFVVRARDSTHTHCPRRPPSDCVCVREVFVHQNTMTKKPHTASHTESVHVSLCIARNSACAHRRIAVVTLGHLGGRRGRARKAFTLFGKLGGGSTPHNTYTTACVCVRVGVCVCARARECGALFTQFGRRHRAATPPHHTATALGWKDKSFANFCSRPVDVAVAVARKKNFSYIRRGCCCCFRGNASERV